MKVKTLIKELQKLDPESTVGTFADSKYDFIYTPIGEIFTKNDVELHGDFRGKGKKVSNNYVVLVGVHQDWHIYFR